jgi:glycosyltransferase involved in cell wall biosynthesis
MRILHFCQSFSPISETFIYDLIIELERRGTDSHVVTSVLQNCETRPYQKVHIIKRPSRWDPRFIGYRALARLGFGHREEASWPMIRYGLERVVTGIKPDVIHAQFGPAGVIASPVADQHNIPFIVSFHGYDVSRLARSEFWRKKYNELWHYRGVFTGVSHFICNRLKQLGAPERSIYRMSNGVRLNEFQYNCPTDCFDGSLVECLFVGRLVEKKAPLTLVQSFQNALKLLPSSLRMVLHMVGDGPLMPKLREYVQESGLQEVVQLYGALSHSRVRDLMRRVHIYVQHSITAEDGDQEGQPVSIIEAAACGLPIVSTRHSGIPEIVLDGQTGFLVEENNVGSMGERIAFLAMRPKLWKDMGHSGRDHVEKNMNLEKQVELWLDLYRETMSFSRPNE